jgi:hypothetical protein
MMAVGQNLLWIVVVPWVAGSIFWLVARLLTSMGLFFLWHWALQFVWLALGLGYLWWLLRWSQRRLFGRFRELAAQP